MSSAHGGEEDHAFLYRYLHIRTYSTWDMPTFVCPYRTHTGVRKQSTTADRPPCIKLCSTALWGRFPSCSTAVQLRRGLLRLSYDDGEGEISCLSNPHLTGIYPTWVPPTPSQLVNVIAVRQACWIVAYTTGCVGSGVSLCSSSGFASCLKSSREPWIRTVCGPWMCLSQDFSYKVSSSFIIHRRIVFSHTAS